MELPESKFTNSSPSIESTHKNDDDDDHAHSSSKLLLGGIDMISSPFTYKKREKELRMKERRMKRMNDIGKERRDRRRSSRSSSKYNTSQAYVPDDDDFRLLLFDITLLSPSAGVDTTPVGVTSVMKFNKDGNDEGDTCTTAATAPTTATYHSPPPPPPPPRHIRSPTSSSSSSPCLSPSNDISSGSKLLLHLSRQKYDDDSRTEILSHSQSKNNDLFSHMTIQIPTPSPPKSINEVR